MKLTRARWHSTKWGEKKCSLNIYVWRVWIVSEGMHGCTCKEHKHVLHNSVQMFKRELINISSPRQTEYVFCYKINYVQRVQGIHWYMVTYWCVCTFTHWIIDWNLGEQHGLSPSFYFLPSFKCRQMNRLHIVLVCDIVFGGRVVSAKNSLILNLFFF